MHDVTDNQGRPARLVKCEVCGLDFPARRSDATACSAMCRQRRSRRQRDPVATATRSDTRDGTRKRAPLAMVENVIGPLGGAVLAEAFRLANIPEAIRSPDAPLDAWDAKLTEQIRVLTRVRRAIRDERRREK